MSNDIIETVSGEEGSLELHVKLCEQRYKQLINKFDTVEHRLDRLEGHIVDIKDAIKGTDTTKYKTYLGWAGVAITVIVGASATIIAKLISH